MQKQNAAEMAEQLKKMGMDPNDFAMGSTYADPELAELDREMKRRGKSTYQKVRSVLIILSLMLCRRGRLCSDGRRCCNVG